MEDSKWEIFIIVSRYLIFRAILPLLSVYSKVKTHFNQQKLKINRKRKATKLVEKKKSLVSSLDAEKMV